MNGSWPSHFMDRLVEDMRFAFQDPMANPMLLFVFIGMLIVLFLMAATVVYFIYSVATKNRFRLPVRVPVAQRQAEKWITRAALIGAALAIVFGSSYYTGRESFCSYCHASRQESKSLKKTRHKDLSCLDCHQEPGISGFLRQKIDYTRWVAIALNDRDKKPGRAEVSNAACLKCHSAVAGKTISGYGIRVRHRDFLDTGAKCGDCHNSVAHPGVTKPEKSPSMDRCMVCHNGKTASAKCDECHQNDIGSSIRMARREVVKTGVIAVSWNFCYRCHEEQRCTSCHGVTMPHPPNWVSEVAHAKPAFEKPDVCWRCHDLPQAPLQPTQSAFMKSCGCHGTMGYHGNWPWEYWRKNHGPIAIGAKPGDGENENCYRCHSAKLCDFCHLGKGYKAKNPPPTPAQAAAEG